VPIRTFRSSQNTARERDSSRGRMVEESKYKSVAIKVPYYDALVRMGLTMHRGPGQEMMYIIDKEARARDIKIKSNKKGQKK